MYVMLLFLHSAVGFCISADQLLQIRFFLLAVIILALLLVVLVTPLCVVIDNYDAIFLQAIVVVVASIAIAVITVFLLNW